MYSRAHFSNLRLGNTHLSHLLNLDDYGTRNNDWKFLWSKRLTRHTSCVNALALSQNGGRWLASGGDDLTIQLWDFYQEDISHCPLVSFAGPMMNILTLAFSNSNKYLFSGGSDAVIQQYDVSRLGENSGHSMKGSDESYKEEESVRSVSCHPFRDEIFMSGSESGTITQRDVRTREATRINPSTICLSAEVTSLQYHPQIENFFITSDSVKGVRLWDARMAWTGGSKKGVVQRYNTRLCRKNVTHSLADPETSSAVFDRDGSKLAVTLLHYLPTIYALSDPNPLAVCSPKDSLSNQESALARELEEDEQFEATQERTYSNSCTMKHGSFGGFGLPTDDFYCAGSDDFRAYLWRVPKVEELKEARLEVDRFSSIQWRENQVAFAEDLTSKRYVPRELSMPIYRLTGHQSIVNTALIHPELPHIVTAGIERHILLHSPTPSASCAADLELTPQKTRSLNQFESVGSGWPESLDADADIERSERETIMFFDGLLTVEGEADPFDIRQWRPSTSESNSSDYSSDGDDMDDDYNQIV